MPIIVKEFTWKQTPTVLNITIPLNPVKKEKVDLFATDSYIKAHYSPFLFEVFLLHEVNIDRSQCVVQDDLIVLDLLKKEEQEWSQLEKDLTKAEKMKLRQEILEKCQERAKEESEEKRIKKSQMDRFTVQKAMEIDSRHHSLMDARRDEQRKLAMDALEEWRVNADNGSSNGVKIVELPDDKENGTKIVELPDDKENGTKIVELPDDKENGTKIVELPDDKENGTKIVELPDDKENGTKIVELPDDKENGTKIVEVKEKPTPREATAQATRDERRDVEQDEKQTESTEIVQASVKAPQPTKPCPRKPVKIPVRSEFVEKKKAEAAARVLPGVRAAGACAVRHTPRVFPTPSRESARQEEEAWLKNVTAARRATGFVSEDLRPEEQDPQWCKYKGDELFRAGNLLGAVSAYSHGARLSERLPGLHAARAAAHFALGNFYKCVSDCSTALELLQPACEGNRRARAACLARRGAGLARMGRLRNAIDEMKAAAKLLPDHAGLQQDLYAMERAWEQNPDSD